MQVATVTVAIRRIDVYASLSNDTQSGSAVTQGL